MDELERNPMFGKAGRSAAVEGLRLFAVTALITGAVATLFLIGAFAWWFVTCSGDPTASHRRIG